MVHHDTCGLVHMAIVPSTSPQELQSLVGQESTDINLSSVWTRWMDSMDLLHHLLTFQESQIAKIVVREDLRETVAVEVARRNEQNQVSTLVRLQDSWEIPSMVSEVEALEPIAAASNSPKRYQAASDIHSLGGGR